MTSQDKIVQYKPLHELNQVESPLQPNDLFLVSVLSAQSTESNDAIMLSKCISYGTLLSCLSIDLGLADKQ